MLARRMLRDKIFGVLSYLTWLAQNAASMDDQRLRRGRAAAP